MISLTVCGPSTARVYPRKNQDLKSLTIKTVLGCNTSIALHFYTPRFPLPISLPSPVFFMPQRIAQRVEILT